MRRRTVQWLGSNGRVGAAAPVYSAWDFTKCTYTMQTGDTFDAIAQTYFGCAQGDTACVTRTKNILILLNPTASNVQPGNKVVMPHTVCKQTECASKGLPWAWDATANKCVNSDYVVCIAGGGQWNTSNNACNCPPGKQWDDTAKRCMYVNTAIAACTTAGGTWNVAQLKCDCGTGKAWDDTTKSCVAATAPAPEPAACPPDAPWLIDGKCYPACTYPTERLVVDSSGNGTCDKCPTGQLRDANDPTKCVECPTGQKLDEHGECKPEASAAPAAASSDSGGGLLVIGLLVATGVLFWSISG